MTPGQETIREKIEKAKLKLVKLRGMKQQFAAIASWNAVPAETKIMEDKIKEIDKEIALNNKILSLKNIKLAKREAKIERIDERYDYFRERFNNKNPLNLKELKWNASYNEKHAILINFKMRDKIKFKKIDESNMKKTDKIAIVNAVIAKKPIFSVKKEKKAVEKLASSNIEKPFKKEILKEIKNNTQSIIVAKTVKKKLKDMTAEEKALDYNNFLKKNEIGVIVADANFVKYRSQCNNKSARDCDYLITKNNWEIANLCKNSNSRSCVLKRIKNIRYNNIKLKNAIPMLSD
ncbi:MAG: hypothetical protein WCH77_12340 [Planctomycetota bacterium]